MEESNTRQMLPQEFKDAMQKLLPEDELESFLESYQKPALHGLRFRSEEAREAVLNAKDAKPKLLDPVEWAPLSYYYEDASRPGLLPFHDMGLYYIQEPSAMGPAALLAPKPGERVLDLCAAPGGKSTELAYYLKGQGLLVANEIMPNRAKILSSNMERMGIANALVLNEDSHKLSAYFPAFFHSILVDAPCSGEGMFRKNPEAIAEWSLDNVALCADRQAEILDEAAKMLLPGGRMVYSTCTFAKEENEDTVAGFLARHPDFSLVESRRFWPHKDLGEGHFMALFTKAGELRNETYPSEGKPFDKAFDKATGKLLKDFFTDCFSDAELLKHRFDADQNGFLAFGDQLYLAPPQCPSLKGLKVLRAGLHLGEKKKDRFEPAHALALAPPKEAFRRTYEVTEAGAYAYQRGEGLSGLTLQKEDCGWTALTYCNFPLGWGKASGNQIKNHCPKGLRRS